MKILLILLASVSISHAIQVSSVTYRTIDDDTLLVDIFKPATNPSPPYPAVVFVHGGNWFKDDHIAWETEANELLALGYIVFNARYRRAPWDGEPANDNHWPAPADDIEYLVSWIKAPAQVATYGHNPNRIALMGESAGSQIMMMAAARNPGVKAVLSFSGATNMQALESLTSTETPGDINIIQNYIGCTRGACPSTWIAASPDLQTTTLFPPTFMAHSTSEGVPIANAMNMCTAMRTYCQFLEVEGSGHAIHGSGGQPYKDATWPTALVFLNRYIKQNGMAGKGGVRTSNVGLK